MIYLVVGKIGGGKSTLLHSIFAATCQGDGLINRRVYQDDIWIGQDIVRLSTGEKVRFTIRDGYTPPNWDELWRLGNLTFSRNGMVFAEQVMQELIDNAVSPIFLDEIGPLELSERGFHRQFLQMINAGWNIYAAVRAECLDKVVAKYGLREFSLIPAASP